MALRLSSRCFRLHIKSRLFNQQLYFFTTQSNKNNENADIVISGGGMVGGAMACALGNSEMFKDKKIILLEASKDRGPFQLPDNFSNRTCALSPATHKLLDSFGAWKELEAMRCHPIVRMQVWESCSDSLITFNQEDMNENLATMAENDVIQAAIFKTLTAMENRVEVRYDSKVDSYILPGKEEDSITQPYCVLQLQDGSVINTKLLIGADGSDSKVRKTAGFHTTERDYKQTAVVATLHLGESQINNTAWQRFLPTGPIAILPLSDSVSSLVWTTTPEKAQYLKEIDNEKFVDEVNDALWHERDKDQIAGKLLDTFKSALNVIMPDSEQGRQLPPTILKVQDGSRASFPLKLIHSSNYVQSRVALIGDAGHRLHPLAGQGVNLGFGDVDVLTRVLESAARDGADPGSLTTLLRYETERQKQNVPVMVTIDGLQRLFSTAFTPLVILRSLGLHATHSAPFIKKQIIDKASV